MGMGMGIVDNHDVFFPFSPKIQRCRFERLELEGGWVRVMTHESWCSFPKFQRCRFESGSWSFLEPRMCCRVGFSSLFVHFPLFFSSHKTKSLYIHHYVHDSPIPISLLSLSLTFYGDKEERKKEITGEKMERKMVKRESGSFCFEGIVVWLEATNHLWLIQILWSASTHLLLQFNSTLWLCVSALGPGFIPLNHCSPIGPEVCFWYFWCFFLNL